MDSDTESDHQPVRKSPEEVWTPTPPSKLHNFDLPGVKWATVKVVSPTNCCHHRRCRSTHADSKEMSPLGSENEGTSQKSPIISQDDVDESLTDRQVHQLTVMTNKPPVRYYERRPPEHVTGQMKMEEPTAASEHDLENISEKKTGLSSSSSVKPLKKRIIWDFKDFSVGKNLISPVKKRKSSEEVDANNLERKAARIKPATVNPNVPETTEDNNREKTLTIKPSINQKPLEHTKDRQEKTTTLKTNTLTEPEISEDVKCRNQVKTLIIKPLTKPKNSEDVKAPNSKPVLTTPAAKKFKIVEGRVKEIAVKTVKWDPSIEKLEKQKEMASEKKAVILEETREHKKLSIHYTRRPRKKGDEESDDEDDEEVKIKQPLSIVPKTWNFRPRRPSLGVISGGTMAHGATTQVHSNPPYFNQSGDLDNAKKSEKSKEEEGKLNNNEEEDVARKGKFKGKIGGRKKTNTINFSIALREDEIAEDILLITGSMPSRKPKKRSKSQQELVDNCFPGRWLHSITPGSYRVAGSSSKVSRHHH